MQNAQISLADDDNLDLAQGPTSLTSLPETTTTALRELAPTPPIEVVQSDTEIRPKIKGRSRFSTAIRKLSGSTRKKQQQSQKDSIGEKAAGSKAPETTSGTENQSNLSLQEAEREKDKEKAKDKDKEKDKGKIKEKEKAKEKEKEKEKDTEKEKEKDKEQEKDKDKEQSKSKKKSRLSKKFLLPALKKSKISPKTNVDESENDEIAKISANTSKSPKQSRVQITISGKKIEQPLTSAEADYLTPSEEITNPNEKVVEPATEEPSKAKKKLKAKKTLSSTTRTPSEEKLVITQSIRDAPPYEKAPLKPSRSLAGACQAIESTETEKGNELAAAALAASAVIRKPPASATAAISPSSIAQRFIGGTGSSKKQRVGVESESVEADLMQTPSGSLQRGHRLPRPSSVATAVAAATPTKTEPSSQAIASPSPSLSSALSTTTAAESTHFAELSPQLQQQLQQQRQKQRQIQFQLKSPSETTESSHASQSLPQSPDVAIAPISSGLLPASTYSPPPVPSSPAVTPQSRSPAYAATAAAVAAAVAAADTHSLIHRSHPYQKHQQHTIPYAHESVTIVSSSRADELPSSTDSSAANQEQQHKQKQQQEQDYDAEVASYLGAASTTKDSIRLRRHGTTSTDSIKSSGSQSPLSESSRKRIHYVAQPTLYDETVNRRQRSDDFRLTTEASEQHTFEADTDSGDKQMPAFGDLAMDEEMEPTIMTSANAEKREHLYKILVIGELGTGKTSFIKRYVHQFFSQNYRATIGVDFALKVLHWDPNTIVRLQLWDIAGQERFGNMTRVYYKEAVGAFIVFDVTRSGTFECVSKWKEDLDSKVQLPDGSPIPCILLANKCDQEKQGIVTQPEKMDEYVKENGFSGWFETSAKENTNIDEAARALVSKILLNDKLISAADLADSEKFNLNNALDEEDLESKKCSC